MLAAVGALAWRTWWSGMAACWRICWKAPSHRATPSVRCYVSSSCLPACSLGTRD